MSDEAKIYQDMKDKTRARVTHVFAAVKLDEAEKEGSAPTEPQRSTSQSCKGNGLKFSLDFCRPPPPYLP